MPDATPKEGGVRALMKEGAIMRVPPKPQVDQLLAREAYQVFGEQGLELRASIFVGFVRTEQDVGAPVTLAIPQDLAEPCYELGLLEAAVLVIISVDADELKPAGPEAEVAALLLLSVRVRGLLGVDIVKIGIAARHHFMVGIEHEQPSVLVVYEPPSLISWVIVPIKRSLWSGIELGTQPIHTGEQQPAYGIALGFKLFDGRVDRNVVRYAGK
jgi:hypothetical protein